MQLEVDAVTSGVDDEDRRPLGFVKTLFHGYTLLGKGNKSCLYGNKSERVVPILLNGTENGGTSFVHDQR